MVAQTVSQYGVAVGRRKVTEEPVVNEELLHMASYNNTFVLGGFREILCMSCSTLSGQLRLKQQNNNKSPVAMAEPYCSVIGTIISLSSSNCALL